MSETTPSFLYEVFESESEEEEIEKPGPEEKVAAKPNPKLICFLCGDLQHCCCGLAEVVEASEYTFSDVLTKLFSREQLPPSLAEKDYSQGLLCTYCRYLVSDLFRLQRELKTVKNVIVRTFKDSENKDIKGISSDDYETEPISVHNRTNAREKPKDTEKDEKVKSCEAKNQKRKRESVDNSDETYNGKAEAKQRGGRKQSKDIEEVSTEDWDFKPIKELKRKSTSKKYEVKVKYEEADQSDKHETYEKEKVLSKNRKSKREFNKYFEVVHNGKPEAEQMEAKCNTSKSNDIEQQISKEKGKRNGSLNQYQLLDKETIDSDGIKGLIKKDSYREETEQGNCFEENANDEDDDNDNAPVNEAVYNIEALVATKGSTYLVKWENYPDDQNTWEPNSSIPDLIVEYYEADSSRLGKPLPSDFARFEDAIQEVDDNMWQPEEDKKENRVSAKKRSSAESSAKKRLSTESPAKKGSSTKSPAKKRSITESSAKKRLSIESLKNTPMEKETVDEEVYNGKAQQTESTLNTYKSNVIKQQTTKQKRNKRGSLNQVEPLANKTIESDGIKELTKEYSENSIDEEEPASTNDKEKENDETYNGKSQAKQKSARKQSKKFEEVSTNEWDFKPIKVLKRRSDIKRYEVKIKYEDANQSDQSEKYKKEEIYESKNRKRESIGNPEEVYDGKAEALQTEATYDVAQAIEHQFLTQKRKSQGSLTRDELLNKETIERGGRKGIAKKDSYVKENEPENNIVDVNTASTTDDDKDNDDAPVAEAVYNIEALVEKKGSSYLVKWENYPDDQNTWEHYCSIPEMIVEYYEAESSRLGKPLPSYFARFEDAIQEEMMMTRDDDMWQPEEDKKVIEVSAKKSFAKKRLSTESFKYTPMEKGKQDEFKETKPTPKRKSKKLSLEDAKPNDPNAKVIERLMAKNGPKYLVKWLKQSEDENTWEHKSAIPKHILKYYERDLSRLGTSPPAMDSDMF